jgi:hypothetical protein
MWGSVLSFIIRSVTEFMHMSAFIFLGKKCYGFEIMYRYFLNIALFSYFNSSYSYANKLDNSTSYTVTNCYMLIYVLTLICKMLDGN